MAKICKNCGEKLFPNDTFCGFCGADVVDEPEFIAAEELALARAELEAAEAELAKAELEASEAELVRAELEAVEAELATVTDETEATDTALTAEEELALAQAELEAAEAELAAVTEEASALDELVELDSLNEDVSELNAIEGISAKPVEQMADELFDEVAAERAENDETPYQVETTDEDEHDEVEYDETSEYSETSDETEGQEEAKDDFLEGFLTGGELNATNVRWEMAQAKASELQKKEDALKRRAMIENKPKHLGRDIVLLIIGIIILIGIFIYIAKDDLKGVVGNDSHNRPAAITSVVSNYDFSSGTCK